MDARDKEASVIDVEVSGHARSHQAKRFLLPAPSLASTLCNWLATHLVYERLIRHK